MARRNLLAEAQVTAAAQVAPQVAALSEALRQARTDRNSAIRAASAANAGIAHAIHLAGSSVKKGYTGAQALAAPAQSYSGANYGQAASNERKIGTTALASSLGNALKELSDRRISAAAGRAYSTQRALSDYEGKVAGVQSKRQGLAAQQGLLTGSTLSKLTEAQAGRDLQSSLQSQRLNSQSQLQSQRLSSQSQLQSERLASQETVAGARLRSSEHTAALGRRQQKLGRLNQQRLQSQRLNARTGAGAPIKPSKDQIAQTQNYFKAIQGYKTDGAQKISMRHTAANYDKLGIPRVVTNAAADYYTKGHVTQKSAEELAAIGVIVPKSHIGVTVRSHTRKRRGS